MGTLLSGLILAALIAFAQQPRSLARVDIDQLIGLMPDRALADEIRQRGVAFKLDEGLLDHFRELKAGPGTLASLLELLPNSKLVVLSNLPNCDVSLNEKPAGRTDDAGNLVLSGLDAGPALLRVTRDGYQGATYKLTLSRGQTTELRAVLSPAAPTLPPSSPTIKPPRAETSLMAGNWTANLNDAQAGHSIDFVLKGKGPSFQGDATLKSRLGRIPAEIVATTSNGRLNALVVYWFKSRGRTCLSRLVIDASVITNTLLRGTTSETESCDGRTQRGTIEITRPK
jgi:hypothetical protein